MSSLATRSTFVAPIYELLIFDYPFPFERRNDQ